MAEVDWRALAEQVWLGKTLQEACTALGYDWHTVYAQMRDPDFRRLYVDIAIVARVRDDMISAQSN